MHYARKWYIIHIYKNFGDDELRRIKELWKLYAAFFKIGILTFGGGCAMLPMIEREIVVKHQWATMEEIMDYFAISQCTPGVIAVNTATFIGYKNKGVLGGIVATLGVITPSIIIISLIASVLQTFYDNRYVKAAFQGIGVAVCAVLVQAVIKIGKSGIIDVFTAIIAVVSFLVAAFLGVPTIAIIITAGIVGVIYKVIREKKSNEAGGNE